MPHEFHIHSPIGNLKLIASELGVQSLEFSDVDYPDLPAPGASKAPLVQRLQTQLNEYFDGSRTEFDIPFDLQGTDFQVKVWNLLQSIPYGTTMSYTQLADRYGERNAVRAVASANAKNKIAILIPCHRIIGTDGSLTGYAWGINKKRSLLELEGGLAKQRQLPLD
jgi:methylated-DNA-[protein]-cysteine S-methyltransferase